MELVGRERERENEMKPEEIVKVLRDLEDTFDPNNTSFPFVKAYFKLVTEAIKNAVDFIEAHSPSLPVDAILDAAVELVVFAKTHNYPNAGTEDFFKLTALVDGLETALRSQGILKGAIKYE